MSVCFYPTPRLDTSSPRKIERYQFLDEINLFYRIDKSIIHDLLQHILKKYCDVSVFGYNINTNKYWCKIYGKTTCELYVEIYVKGLYFDACELYITPLIGEAKFINKFIDTLNKNLYTYNNFY